MRTAFSCTPPSLAVPVWAARSLVAPIAAPPDDGGWISAALLAGNSALLIAAIDQCIAAERRTYRYGGCGYLAASG